MATDIIINYENIISAISSQIQVVWEELVASKDETVSKMIKEIKSIEISDEQYYRKEEEDRTLRRGTVYLVVRFGAGSINYGASVSSISITALGVANQVKPVQLLLSVFSSTWTTKNLAQELKNARGKSLEISNAMQVWNTPEVISNFNIVDTDFRNLYKITGNIVVGASAVRIGKLTYYYDEDNEENNETVNIMSFQDGFSSSLDTQPFGNIHGFTQSEVNFSTYTFAISTYLLSNHLSADLLAMRGFRNRNSGSISSTKNPNDKLKIKIEFTNGFTNMPSNEETSSDEDPILGDTFFSYFKVVNSQLKQEIAGIPTITITFTR